VRAVLDPNVIISALLSPRGSPATVLQGWIGGEYELVVSPLLLQELERALGYPKLGDRITKAEAEKLVALLSHEGDMHEDPDAPPPVRSIDAGDDYLIALAVVAQAVIVSGDRHLLDLGEDVPVYSPAGFLAMLEEGRDT
jgi:putative PIN family toxin of toxin-antitoxin system